MTARHLILEDFKGSASPRRLFSASLRLTLQRAFNAIGAALPPDSSVLFSPFKGGIVVDLCPFSGADEATDRIIPEITHLAYQLYPEHGSVLIHRIKVREGRRTGIGSAMIASQYPFWRQMGVTALAVKAHDLSEGFYRKLGFVPVTSLPEDPLADPAWSTPMRLDLADPACKAVFEAALAKAPRLTRPAGPV